MHLFLWQVNPRQQLPPSVKMHSSQIITHTHTHSQPGNSLATSRGSENTEERKWGGLINGAVKLRALCLLRFWRDPPNTPQPPALSVHICWHLMCVCTRPPLASARFMAQFESPGVCSQVASGCCRPGGSTGACWEHGRPAEHPVLFLHVSSERAVTALLKQGRWESVCHSGGESVFPCNTKRNLPALHSYNCSDVFPQRVKSQSR